MARNAKLIAELNQLQEIAGLLGEPYREKAYRRAINSLGKLPIEITKDNLSTVRKMKIPGIGEGIMNKIVEWAKTGKIAEISKLKKSPEYRAYQEFSGIAGVGPATIREWAAQRVYTRAQLRKAISTGRIKLNHMQKYGLKYYTDLNSRIPRDEVTKLSEYIKRLLIQSDPGVIFSVAGSYRRGLPNSGDIDILVSNKDRFHDTLLSELVDSLHSDRNFIDTLSTGKERVTFLYRSPISGKVRQIDVLNIPYGSYYAALNYFTGSWQHNERLRGIAKTKGYRLNQAGLFKYVGKDKKMLELIPTRSEEEIYRILGERYIPPEQR